MRHRSALVAVLALGLLHCGARRAEPAEDLPDAAVPATPAALGWTPRAVVAIDANTWRARQDLRGVAATFHRDGRIDLEGARGAARWHGSLALQAIEGASFAAARDVVTAGERLELRRGDVTEWYVNGASGLEQGFDVAKGGDQLALTLSLDGFTARVNAAGVATLSTALGDVLAVHGLSAVDAHGRRLPTKMVAADGRLRIDVDARDAAYPIVVDPYYTPVEQKLLASDGAANNKMGASVAISGDTAVVGAPGANAAYVFVRSGTTWTMQQKLTGTGVAPGNEFGFGVAVAGDTAVVGAWNHDHGGGTANYGAAYVFVRSGTTWTEQQKLIGYDGASKGLGRAVAITTGAFGALVVAGAPYSNAGGDAYFYRRNAGSTTWAPENKVSPSDGVSLDDFGSAVAIDGEWAVVGARYSESGGFNRGGAYPYYRTTSWIPYGSKIVATDGADNDYFGWSVAISGQRILVGSPGHATKGAAYAFYASGASYVPDGSFTGGDAVPGILFGHSVALKGTAAVVSAVLGNSTSAGSSGAAYFFTRATTWNEQGKLVPNDGAAYDEYGESIAFDGDTVVVGARKHDAKATDAGGAYVHRATPTKALGESCAIGGECTSSFCVDGVCCNDACAGSSCRACTAAKKGSGADGTCDMIKDGTDPDLECLQASCSGGTQNNAQVCNGSGQCRGNGTTACGLYGCAGATCATSCTIDGQCVAGAFCNGSLCVADLANGASCARAAQCTSNFCVDGICCDKACDGKCQACTTAKKGSGSDGVCEAVAADSDPDNDCAAGSTTCGADGFCDGAGACRQFAKASTACGATACTDGKVSGQVCNGAGACADNPGASCAPYGCGGTACKTSCTDATAAADCATTAYCTSTSTCAPKKTNGTTCSASRECQTGFCVDGVCCASACNGQCEACGESGTEGTCLTVSGVPRGKRVACAGDPATCGGKCDGVNATACNYAASTKECGTACTGASETKSTCDGKGECVAGAPRACNGFVCDSAGKCATACTKDTECATGFRCAAGACVPSGGAKCKDIATSIAVGGNEIACAPFTCDESTGGCRVVCTATSECAAGYNCDSATKSCIQPAPVEESSGGCQTGRARSSASGLLALVLGALLARRRLLRA